MKKILFSISICFLSLTTLFAQKSKQRVNNITAANAHTDLADNREILPGAYQTEEYIPLLQGKRVGVFANNTATVRKTHLVDTLKKLGVNIAKIFGPEPGFRGTANAGEKVDTYTDPQTGILVISLYGKKRKPSAEDLADVDIFAV